MRARQRAGLLLAIALGAVSISCSSGMTTAPEPVLETRVTVANQEELALLLLESDRLIYEPFTVSQLSREGPELREQLALALGRIGSTEGRVTLELLLGDTAPRVRQAAAFALGEVASEDSIEGLLGAVADPDRETGRLAVEALGKIGVDLFRIQAVLSELPGDEMWQRVLPSLYRLEESFRVAAEGLDQEDSELHRWAAFALCRTPQVEALPFIRPLLSDPDAQVRAWAARALGRVGDTGDMERLTPLLDDHEEGPVIQALAAGSRLVDLGVSAPLSQWREPLLVLLSDARTGVRLAAIDAASRWLRDPDLGPALAGLFENGSGRARELALVSLARGGDPGAEALVARAARTAEPRLRAAAARGAGFIEAKEILYRLLEDDVPLVRTAAWEEALAATDESAPFSPAAERALEDPDPGVRAVALEWLVEHPLVEVDLLELALERTRTDSIRASAWSAVAAIRARAEAEVLERGAAVALLEENAQERDFMVRWRAAEALAELKRPVPPLGAVESPLNLEAYRGIVERTRQSRDVIVETARGNIRIRVDCPEAPLTCLSFLQLAGQGFYDGLTFHRVVPDFVVQGGDPRSDGWGGPGYTLRDEVNRLRFATGVVGMAHSGPHTAGSQFFITLAPQPHLDGDYTVFGKVTEGLDVLRRIEAGDGIVTIKELGVGLQPSAAMGRMN